MCNWSFNVHRRTYSRHDTVLWEEDIAVILSDAEGLYPTKFATCVTHYLVHIPFQLRNLGPLLCWGMYGLERFGDYLMKMSLSRHPHKHVSIARNYVWHELAGFLAVHDPILYPADSSGYQQPHMFSSSMVSDPSSWTVSVIESRAICLPPVLLAKTFLLYSTFFQQQSLGVVLQPHHKFESGAAHILGKLWCGTREYQAYYEGCDQFVLGKGHCCITWFSSSDSSFDGRDYGVIRNIFHHQAFLSPKCPEVYIFEVELLDVVPSSTDVPLLEAKLSEQRVLISQANLDSAAVLLQFCLRDHDDASKGFYLIELT
jgi:hypothetical protein